MTEVEWHPFPKERPSEKDWGRPFFVTITFHIPGGDPVTQTQIGHWSPVVAEPGSPLHFGKPSCCKLSAWARIDFPEPYEPLDMHPDAIAARKYAEEFDKRQSKTFPFI